MNGQIRGCPIQKTHVIVQPRNFDPIQKTHVKGGAGQLWGGPELISSHIIENVFRQKWDFDLVVLLSFQRDPYATMRLLLLFISNAEGIAQDSGPLGQNTCAARGLRPTLFAPPGAVRTPCDGVQTHWACAPTCGSGHGRWRYREVLVAAPWAVRQ